MLRTRSAFTTKALESTPQWGAMEERTVMEPVLPVLRVGLAGVGSVSRTILHNIQKIPDVKLTALAGPFRWKEAGS